MKIFSFLSIIFIFSILFLHPAKDAFAVNKSSTQILKISPVVINVQLSPGKTYQYPITITNLTDQPLPLHASLNDFLTTGEEGGYVFEDSRTNPLLSWINLSEQDVILAAKESKKITLTVNTPKSIPLGGYYGLLFFEPVIQNNLPAQTRIVPRVGVLMLANIGIPDTNAKPAQILTFDTGLLHETNQIPLLLRVKNISLHFFTAKPILTISPLLPLLAPRSLGEVGSPLKSPLYLEDKIIFQDKIRRWEQQITLPYSLPNIYKLHLALSAGNGIFVTRDTYVLIFPYKKATIVLVFLCIGGFLLIKRKRLKKAIKVFLKND